MARNSGMMSVRKKIKVAQRWRAVGPPGLRRTSRAVSLGKGRGESTVQEPRAQVLESFWQPWTGSVYKLVNCTCGFF